MKPTKNPQVPSYDNSESESECMTQLDIQLNYLTRTNEMLYNLKHSVQELLDRIKSSQYAEKVSKVKQDVEVSYNGLLPLLEDHNTTNRYHVEDIQELVNTIKGLI